MKSEKVVISAVNFTEGGPLTVLRDCLLAASLVLPEHWEIIALVHKSDLINIQRVHTIEITDAKKSWFKRLYWEWFGFKKISLDLSPVLWFSLHDITPRVAARRQAVYCHNPAPFYEISLQEAFREPSFFIFNILYKYFYKLFIRRNFLVIVQQDWLRNKFKRWMPCASIIVAHPILIADKFTAAQAPKLDNIFFYPALPRVFKNIEILCEASRILCNRGISNFKVRLTINGDENRYARWILDKYGDIPSLSFIGCQSKEAMINEYLKAPVVIFPSKLETWGLPISEAKAYSLPLLVADLPYAKETVGSYAKVSFFSVDSALSLADLMESIIQKKWIPSGSKAIFPSEPYASGWEELWKILIAGLVDSSVVEKP